MTNTKLEAKGGKVWDPYSNNSEPVESVHYYFPIFRIFNMVPISWVIYFSSLTITLIFGYIGIIKEKFYASDPITTTSSTFVREDVDNTWAMICVIIMGLALLFAILTFIWNEEESITLVIAIAFLFSAMGGLSMFIVKDTVQAHYIYNESNAWSEEAFDVSMPVEIDFLTMSDGDNATATNKSGEAYLFNVTITDNATTITANQMTVVE